MATDSTPERQRRHEYSRCVYAGSGDEAVRTESRAVIGKVKKYRSKEGIKERAKGEYSRSKGQGEGWSVYESQLVRSLLLWYWRK